LEIPAALASRSSVSAGQRAEASRNIFAYIEGFYHRTRRHPAIGCVSPIEMELKAVTLFFSEQDQDSAFPA
jgi:transposase InsO family protein